MDATTAALQSPKTIDAYQALYDTLGRAYWDATTIDTKDLIQGVREAIYDIITELDEAQLDANTTALLALQPKIEDTNTALNKIKDSINEITKNINTATTVVSAISKVVAIMAPLL
jgi:methyl-accepting chemotaxis protein